MQNLPTIPSQSQQSPSGKYTLRVIETQQDGILYWTFEIINDQGNPVFYCPDQFDIRHSTIILWDDADRVWVYSGDVGLYIWEMSANDHSWKKSGYSQSSLTPPEYLLQAKAKFLRK